MKKILTTAAALAATCALFGIESVKVLTTLPDNRVITKELKAEKIAPDTTRITIPKGQIDPQCKFLDIIADNATAKKGDKGFWILNRGLLGYFNKDNYKYASAKHYMYLPYYAMKTPKETFIGVIDGMRFEFNVLIDIVDGVYTMYPRWHIADMGFDPYEDITITFYTLPADADYNEMAKAYRKHRFAQNKKIKPLKERFATQPYLEKMAKSVPVRMGFAGKPFNRKTDSVNFYPRGGKPFVDAKYPFAASQKSFL